MPWDCFCVTHDIQARALVAAETLDDVRIPPGNRLKSYAAIALIGTASGSTTSGGSSSGGPPLDSRTSRSSTATEGRAHIMSTEAIAPIRPGEVLAEEYLAPLGVTQHRLAVAIGVPPWRINEIVHGTRRISHRHLSTARPQLRHDGTLLDEPARPLRPRDRTRPPSGCARPDHPTRQRLTADGSTYGDPVRVRATRGGGRMTAGWGVRLLASVSWTLR
jgi:hypothetical protein